MSEENKTILNSSGDDTDNKGAASSTGTDTLSKVNEFNFLKQMVSLEEKMKTFYVNFNKLQDNKGSGTFLRSNVTSVRESVNQALRNGIAFKNDVLDEYQSLKMMPKKLVAETALLQSALFIKLCKHQPMTIVTISTFAVMLPSTLISKKAALFNGMIASLLSYQGVSWLNRNHKELYDNNTYKHSVKSDIKKI